MERIPEFFGSVRGTRDWIESKVSGTGTEIDISRYTNDYDKKSIEIRFDREKGLC